MGRWTFPTFQTPKPKAGTRGHIRGFSQGGSKHIYIRTTKVGILICARQLEPTSSPVSDKQSWTSIVQDLSHAGPRLGRQYRTSAVLDLALGVNCDVSNLTRTTTVIKGGWRGARGLQPTPPNLKSH